MPVILYWLNIYWLNIRTNPSVSMGDFMVGETNTMKREGQLISVLPRFIPVGLAGLLSFGSKIRKGRVLMKEFKVLASLALALMLFVDSSTMAQDFQKEAEGGNVGALAINPVTPSTLNAVTFERSSGQGVFRSRNGGDSWVAVDTGLTDLFISALA